MARSLISMLGKALRAGRNDIREVLRDPKTGSLSASRLCMILSLLQFMLTLNLTHAMSLYSLIVYGVEKIPDWSWILQSAIVLIGGSTPYGVNVIANRKKSNVEEEQVIEEEVEPTDAEINAKSSAFKEDSEENS